MGAAPICYGPLLPLFALAAWWIAAERAEWEYWLGQWGRR